jgi:acyl-CoA synthetase (AMP-forming)/AMP-acid ligase II
MLQYGGLEKTGWPGPRLALFAGEVFPIKHLRRLTEIWTRSRWFNLYGPTETNVCTFHEVRPPIAPDVVEPSPIGRPCGDHTLLRIRDADGGTVAGAGAEGSLWVAGDCVFQGYWSRPELDRGVFESIDGRLWYDTGDVVRAAVDGTLTYVGRRDRMVKRTGYRIELGEIETALYKHPKITKVAVVGLRDAEQGMRIVACCTPNGDKPSLIEMKRFCHDNLPHYMAPDAFVWWPTLPLTSTGKIDHQAVARQLSAESRGSSS